MQFFLVVNLMFLCFLNSACTNNNANSSVEIPPIFDKSAMPKEMPKNLKINFNANYGMSPAYKKIEIKNGEISVEANNFVESKKTFEKTAQTGQVSSEELAKLYQTFVENAFDKIKNDDRKEIVYDAGGEGIFISLSDQEYYQQSYGDNQPMSGGNAKRYLNVKKAIFDLAEKAKQSKQANFSDENQQIFEFDAAELAQHISHGKPAKLNGEDFAVIEDSLEKAVAEYNEKQTSAEQKISSLSSYKRQVVPYLNAQGEKEVWLNFFCSVNGLNWRKVIVEVDDGGSCYFETRINLVNKKVFKFYVNGSA